MSVVGWMHRSWWRASFTIPKGPGWWELHSVIVSSCFSLENFLSDTRICSCVKKLNPGPNCHRDALIFRSAGICGNCVWMSSYQIEEKLIWNTWTHKNSAQNLKPVQRLFHRKNPVKKLFQNTIHSLLLDLFGRVLLLSYFFRVTNCLEEKDTRHPLNPIDILVSSDSCETCQHGCKWVRYRN